MQRTPPYPNRGPTSDLGDADSSARDAFLAQPRALLLCAREFDRLSDSIASWSTSGISGGDLHNAEVRRAPGRCIVQLGPVGLTASWVRARVDTVANGRLLVIEWLGTVARGVPQAPERPATRSAAPAKMLNENVFQVDATSEVEWFWRDEAPPQMRYRSTDLAEHCASALRATLRRVEGR
jgi:hypothetical protein